jgi:hypothetical protein
MLIRIGIWIASTYIDFCDNIASGSEARIKKADR